MNTNEKLAKIDQDPETNNAVTEIRRLLGEVINNLARIEHVWDEADLGGEFWTPESGYPFPLSLDEFTAEVEAWHERIGFELEGGIPADIAKYYTDRPKFADLPVLES
jgi:hypothetical protein